MQQESLSLLVFQKRFRTEKACTISEPNYLDVLEFQVKHAST